MIFDIQELQSRYDVIPGNADCLEGQVWSRDHFTDVFRKDGARYTLHFNSKQIVPYRDFDGYLKVKITLGNQCSYLFLHRIIAQLYCTNPDPLLYTQVNHINGIKHDNRIDNLEWCTGSENCKHAVSTGLRKRGAYPVIDLTSGIVYESTYEADRVLCKPLEHTRQKIQNDKDVDGHILRLLIDRSTFDSYKDRFQKYHTIVIKEEDGRLTSYHFD